MDFRYPPPTPFPCPSLRPVGLPVLLAEYLIRSEYVTLKFLETTAVLAPRAFTFGFRLKVLTVMLAFVFFLKHVNDKGNYLMVNQDLNITGTID